MYENIIYIFSKELNILLRCLFLSITKFMKVFWFNIWNVSHTQNQVCLLELSIVCVMRVCMCDLECGACWMGQKHWLTNASSARLASTSFFILPVTAPFLPPLTVIVFRYSVLELTRDMERESAKQWKTDRERGRVAQQERTHPRWFSHLLSGQKSSKTLCRSL